MCHVDADLMCATGFEFASDLGDRPFFVTEPAFHTEMCNRITSLTRLNRLL